MATSPYSRKHSLETLKGVLTQLKDTPWGQGIEVINDLIAEDSYDTVPECDLKAEILSLKKELEEKSQMNAQFEKRLNEGFDSISSDTRGQQRLLEENQTLNQHLQQHKMEIQRLQLELQRQGNPYQEIMNAHKQYIEKLTKDNDKLKDSLVNAEQIAKDTIQQNDKLNSHVKKLKNERESKEARLKDMEKELQNQKHELIVTRTRLSKLMSSQMTDNNPDIADLSDQNRPDKLAERYQELYDNQWSDAFEALDVICSHYSDDKKVALLRQILKEARNFCDKQAFEQTKTLEYALFTGEQSDKSLPDVMKKQLKEMKKAMVPINKGVVAENFLMTYDGHDRKYINRKEMRQFVEECIHVCWIMAMSDPPIMFGPDLHHGEIIDYSFYRSYTTKGSRVNYEVWPPLLVNMDGALLTKGVVEAIIGDSGGQANRVVTKSKTSSTSRPKTAPAGRQPTFLDSDGNRINNILDTKSRSTRSKNLSTTSGTYADIPASAMSQRGSAFKKNYEQQNFSNTSHGSRYPQF